MKVKSNSRIYLKLELKLEVQADENHTLILVVILNNKFTHDWIIILVCHGTELPTSQVLGLNKFQ